AGFMGAHLVNDLLALNEEVIALDDLSGGFKENVNPQATFVEGSINDVQLIDRLFQRHRIDYVFHLAAYAAEGLSHFIKRFNYENNLIGSVNLINASVNHNVKCFVFTSSIAVYGSAQLPMREDLIPIPEDSYGIAKLAVEQELKASKHMFGLNYIIFRPHNVYGEYQNIGDKYRNVVGIFMNQIMQGKPLTVFGDGTQTRAFTYIRDVSPIIAKSIYLPEAYNEIFNIGADDVYTVNDLAKAVCKEFNVESKIAYVPARKEVMHAYSDHSKVRRVFGYKPKHTLEQGIHVMADWAKKVGARKSKKFDNIEIMKNLPPSWVE
ncbi:MAG: NAD-dependent epimerase/dehydratase family protein, partial [Ignavibacteriae bacterium]|nr:NAD-dependent epimerase/dehydratase family protein [Ignavibacteriota bacterium]